MFYLHQHFGLVSKLVKCSGNCGMDRHGISFNYEKKNQIMQLAETWEELEGILLR